MSLPSTDAGLAERLLEEAPVGLVLVTLPGTIAWANSAYFELTGRERSIVGVDLRTIEEKEGSWSPAIRAAVDKALRTGAPTSFSSVRALFPDRPVYLDIAIRRLPDAPSAPAQAILVLRESTDRVREQERSALFYAAFRASTNAMQLTDARGIMIDVNPAFERIYGYSRAECIGRSPNLVRSRYTSPEVYEQLWHDLLDPSRGYWSGEILNRDRVGRERPVLLSITALREGNGPATHYLGVAVDLSEKRSWELRAAHADKLASLGQLAAGVAHEINTPLANIALLTESLRRRSEDPQILARLDRMSGQVEAAARIVRGLLDVARREPAQQTELDLAAVLKESVGFLAGKRSADVDVVLQLPDDATRVVGDRGQLMQVFTNLLNNAYDAMNGRGTIRVELRQGASRVEVDIADTGPGIPPEVLPHLFEPFFTTKPEGSGTGLGLAISHGILQAHHGSIRGENRPDGGAVFRITLPKAPRPSALPATGGPEPLSSPKP